MKRNGYLPVPLLIALWVTSPAVVGQPVVKCDKSVLVSISERSGKLSESEISNFLHTFGKACRNNVEYSEWSNELLFSILDNQTVLTLTTIEKEKMKIELDVILDNWALLSTIL